MVKYIVSDKQALFGQDYAITWYVKLSCRHYRFLTKPPWHLFLERREGKEREGEKHQCVIETPTYPQCALTGNQTVNLSFAGQHSIH